MTLALALSANAHPFASTLAAHRQDIEIAADAVTVRYSVDVPKPIVAASARSPTDDATARVADELRTALLLQVDDEVISLQPIGAPRVTPTHDTLRFEWELLGRTRAAPRRVELSNANLPDVLAVHSGRVRVSGNFTVADCSLWIRDDEVLIRDDTDRWHVGDRYRTVSVDLSPVLGSWHPLWTMLAPPTLEPIDAADARPRGLIDGVTNRVPTPIGAALVLALTLITTIGGRTRWWPGLVAGALLPWIVAMPRLLALTLPLAVTLWLALRRLQPRATPDPG